MLRRPDEHRVSEAQPDERGETCAASLAYAIDWFAANSVSVDRVSTDNTRNSALSNEFRETLDARRIRHIRTRPYRPQTNGKVKRFDRTLVDEFADTRLSACNSARLDAPTPDCPLQQALPARPTRRAHPLELLHNVCGMNS